MKKEKVKYRFKGTVYHFGMIVKRIYEAETMATTMAKALSNIAFQFKKQNNFTPDYKIILKGKCLEVSCQNTERMQRSF